MNVEWEMESWQERLRNSAAGERTLVPGLNQCGIL